ncbi:hypothetical protein ACHAPT_001737 [Fusarium lateritium]
MVEEFLSLKSEDGFSYDSGIGMDSPVKDSVSQYVLGMRKASEQRARLSSTTPMASNLASLAGFRSPMDSTEGIASSISGAPPAMMLPSGVLPAVDTGDSLDLGETPDDLDFHGLGFPDCQDPESQGFEPQDLGLDDLDFQVQSQALRGEEPQSLEPPLPACDLTATTPLATTAKKKPNCPQCEKTFSSVSNRNKHLREGCRFREKSRYPCSYQVLGCTKSLSSFWYQQQHEKDRCKYNPSRARQ